MLENAVPIPWKGNPHMPTPLPLAKQLGLPTGRIRDTREPGCRIPVWHEIESAE